ncbi:MAG: hypothetical protein J6I45_08505 [Clostridia bacterium]|nr:hypothetical protein [Clostridia bacterium]
MDYNEYYRTSGIAKEVRRQNIFRIGATIVCVVLVIIGLALGVPRYAKLETDTNPAFWIFLIVVSILPIAVFKPLKAFDKTWSGKIHRIKEDEDVSMTYSNKAGGTRKIAVTVIHDSGDVSDIVYKGKSADIADNYYKEGDRVIHFAGVNFLYNLDSSAGEEICLFCGYMNHELRCVRCKKPIIALRGKENDT